jgi:hypothetical protein
VGDSAALQVESILGAEQLRVDGIRWSWIVNVGPTVRVNELRRHLPRLLLECENAGIREPQLLPSGHASKLLFVSNDISALGGAGTSRPGSVYLIPGMGGGGAVPEHLEGLPEWLDIKLREPRFEEDLASSPPRTAPISTCSCAFIRRGSRGRSTTSLLQDGRAVDAAPTTGLAHGLVAGDALEEPDPVVERRRRLAAR